MEKDDINVMISNNIFTCRVAALIEKNGKILFQKRKNDLVWALPGGKIRILEKLEDGVRREIFEELGIGIKNLKMVSVTENFFNDKERKVHQYIFTYKCDLESDKYDDKIEFDSIEKKEENKKVIYRWIEKSKLDDFEIRPDNIKEQLEKVEKGEMSFYECE